MVKVIFEVAENGVIKTITDDNFNGAGQKFKKSKLYDFERDKDFKNRIKFFSELALDLNIDLGSIYEKDNLVSVVEWGSKYSPTSKEIEDKIRIKKLELQVLKEMLNQNNSANESNKEKESNEENN